MAEKTLNLEEELIAEKPTQVNKFNFFDRVSDWYFKPKSFEKNPKFYENLGVKGIKKVCDFIGKVFGDNPDSPNNYRIWDKSKEGLEKFQSKTRFNEKIHLPAVVLCGIVATANAIDKDVANTILGVTCVGINAYGVMLQRYNRARLYNTIEKMEARDNSKNSKYGGTKLK